MYTINWYKDGASIDVNPIYGEDVKLSLAKEGNEVYYRGSLEGEFTFCNEDFDLIYNSDISSVFKAKIRLYEGTNNWNYFSEVCEATFTKLDVEFDLDNKIATVKATTADKYDKLLDGLNNEYNLIKLAPARNDVTMYKRALLQIYMLGDTKVSNVIGNLAYEIDAQAGVENKSETEIQSYGFSLLKRYLVITINMFSDSGLTYLNGVYSGEIDDVDNKLVREDGLYYLGKGGGFYGDRLTFFNAVGQIIKPGTDQILGVEFARWTPSAQTNVILFDPSYEDVVGTTVSNARNVYGRILNDKSNPSETAYEIKDDDISERNFNYAYAYGETDAPNLFQQVRNALILSLETQEEPNQWMQDSNGNYFKEPTKENAQNNMIAIGWNCWIPMSFWLDCSLNIANLMAQFDETWVLRDAYRIEDCIQVLLNQIDPTLSFKSDFLELANNPFLEQPLNLYITPITNVKKTYYEQAAQKGQITLKQILDMLKSCFNCYWYIDQYTIANAQGRPVQAWRLRVEHINWFRNGGSYTGEISIALINLNQIKAPLTEKRWAFGQNIVEYDKQNLKNRIEFGWAEDCSEVFNGYPIVFEDSFLKGAGTQRNSVENFISDIDLIISSPANVSDDVFALVGANGNVVYYSKVYYVGADESTEYLLQNPYLSFYFLEQSFWCYEMSGSQALLEGLDLYISPKTLKRIKKQKVSAPYSIKSLEIGFSKIITEIGSGQYEKITTSIATEFSEFELLLDTY